MGVRVTRGKNTRFVYCEGKHDLILLTHLKNLYQTPSYEVALKRGAGGDQPSLVEDGHRRGQGHDKIFVKLDGDRPVKEMATADALATKRGVIIIRTFPAIDRLLLNLIEPKKNINGWSVSRIKKYIHKNYIKEDKRGDITVYEKLFPKKILDKHISSNTDLAQLINIFTSNVD